MMKLIETSSIPEIYVSLGMEIIECGRVVDPRGMKTYELNDVIIEVKDPRKRLILLAGRRYNPAFPIVELLHFFVGDDKPDMLGYYVNNLKMFLNEKTGRFDGCYAPRMTNMEVYDPRAYPKAKKLKINQLEMVYRRLKQDPNSRRAVLAIYNPLYDYNDDSKDIPCNDFLIFRIVDDKLNLTVISRSSDYYVGFIYDSFEFQLLQEIVAGWLSVDVGKFIYHLASLHLYERNVEQFKNIKSVFHPTLYQLNDARLSYESFYEIFPIMLYVEEKYRNGDFSMRFSVGSQYWQNMLSVLKIHNAFKHGKYDIGLKEMRNLQDEFLIPIKDFWSKKLEELGVEI